MRITISQSLEKLISQKFLQKNSKTSELGREMVKYD